jgi:hypothetical protein
MRLLFVTDTGDTYNIEVDPQMEVENLMALLEAEVSPSITITARNRRYADTLRRAAFPSRNRASTSKAGTLTTPRKRS